MRTPRGSVVEWITALVARIPKRLWRPIGAALLAYAVVFVVELAIEHALESPGQMTSTLTTPIIGLSNIYQHVITAGWRKPEPRFTVLVEPNPGRDRRLLPSVSRTFAPSGSIWRPCSNGSPPPGPQ